MNDEEIAGSQTTSRSQVEAEGGAGWPRRSAVDAPLGGAGFDHDPFDGMKALQQRLLRRVLVEERQKCETARLASEKEKCIGHGRVEGEMRLV